MASVIEARERGGIVMFDQSLHRGANALTWLRVHMNDEQTAMRDVAHELKQGLHLDGDSKVVPPPDPLARQRDLILVDEVNRSLTNGNSKIHRRLFVVAYELHLLDAITIRQTILGNNSDGALSGIGCGRLYVPEKLIASRGTIFPDMFWESWSHQLGGDQRFVPLVRCQTVVYE